MNVWKKIYEAEIKSQPCHIMEVRVAETNLNELQVRSF